VRESQTDPHPREPFLPVIGLLRFDIPIDVLVKRGSDDIGAAEAAKKAADPQKTADTTVLSSRGPA
jgi:hypothetical protein